MEDIKQRTIEAIQAIDAEHMKRTRCISCGKGRRCRQRPTGLITLASAPGCVKHAGSMPQKPVEPSFTRIS